VNVKGGSPSPSPSPSSSPSTNSKGSPSPSPAQCTPVYVTAPYTNVKVEVSAADYIKALAAAAAMLTWWTSVHAYARNCVPQSKLTICVLEAQSNRDRLLLFSADTLHAC
jgi:hypothetical protein